MPPAASKALVKCLLCGRVFRAHLGQPCRCGALVNPRNFEIPARTGWNRIRLVLGAEEAIIAAVLAAAVVTIIVMAVRYALFG